MKSAYLISGFPLRNYVTERSPPLTFELSVVVYSANLDAIKMEHLIITF